MEVEAKFSIPDRAVLEQLCQLEALAGYRLEPAGVKSVFDRYLDTDERAILRAGYACRVRRKTGEAGSAPALATLKGLGGADAASGIHRREEYEVQVDDDSPAAWPESPARELALRLSDGRPLRELFSVSQERYLRLVYEDAPGGVRRVAELSLDVVTPAQAGAYRLDDEARPCRYYELEIELLDQGHESDLQAMVADLKATWGLRPEARSKFERGFALAQEAARAEQRGEQMNERLTRDERVALQAWLSSDSLPKQRRALIVLLHDQGHSNSAIAAEVGLSQRQVRRWLAAFRAKRMTIFPGLEAAPSPPGAAERDLQSPVGPDEIAPAAPVTVEELCVHYGVDVARAEYVKGLALRFFDLTADIHGLSPGRRAHLGAAAILHNLGLRLDPARRHLVSRDLILAQPITGFDQTEQDMLASIVAFHRKKVRRRREQAFMRLSSALQQETLVLAALLRIAVGLDGSKSQSTTVDRVERYDGGITFVLAGPMAEGDAVAAQRRANLWHRLFDVDLNFMTEEQWTLLEMEAEAELVSGEGFALDAEAVPELEAPGLLPGDPMSEAGRKLLWFHFLRMLKHEPGTRAGEDIEALHDMRVATRRMRAALRVFGDFYEPKVIVPLNKGLRRVTRALGPVRDLDVFEEKAGRYLEKLPDAARGGLAPLLEAWHAQREVARQKMIDFLDSSRYQKFKRTFAEFLQTEGLGARSISWDLPVPYQVRHVAPRLIYTRYEAVRAYETVLHEARIETLHALRIECKYLRYTLEFLREVLAPEGEAVIEEVKAMQDHLGDLNDADVAIGMLSEFLRTWDTAQVHLPLSQRRSAEGLVNYMAARHAEKHKLLTTFPEAWAKLNREEVRRWMALSIAAL